MRLKNSIPLNVIFCITACLVISVNGRTQNFKTTTSKEGIEVEENGKKVLFYQVKPKSQNGNYERAGYIHPLYSLKGNVVTEDFPEDHPYHHGIFWTWHQIILNNKSIADGWISDKISWLVQDVKVKKYQKKISLLSNVLWKVQTEPGKLLPVISENTTITIFPESKNQRIIVFDIQLYALVDSLKVGGSDDVKGYGGFCLRLKLPDDIEFVSNDSLISPSETAITAGRSMDFKGSFDGHNSPKIVVKLITTPIGNDPQRSWILRKKASMQNIVFPGRQPVLIPKKGLRMRYRMIVSNGE